MVIVFSPEAEVKEFGFAEELSGKLETSDQGLMHTVLQADKKTIEHGEIINEAINQGVGGFTPDATFEQLVSNYKLAERLYGKKLIRLLTGYNPEYVEKNLGIPEFRRELKKRLEKAVDEMKKQKILGGAGEITRQGISLASLVLYVQEVENITPKGFFGEREHRQLQHYGERTASRAFRKGDRYKDLDVRGSVRRAVKRMHTALMLQDLQTSARKAKGSIFVVYGIDASSSMKGRKIETAKKAGVALAFRALQHKDRVGIVVFGSDVKDFVAPTDDFGLLLEKITGVRASMQTDFVKMVEKAVEIMPQTSATKHLLLLTDALPTVGSEPETETLQAVSMARSAGITVSLVGIDLDSKGRKLAKEIVGIGNGRFYIVKNLEELDKLVLEDYRLAAEA